MTRTMIGVAAILLAMQGLAAAQGGPGNGGPGNGGPGNGGPGNGGPGNGGQNRRPEPLARITDAELARFDAGFDEFVENENVQSGLGPVFNDNSCADCHDRPAIGGRSNETVVRFGLQTGATFDPLEDLGGSLRQERGITTQNCSVGGEVVPDAANVVARRITPPLFGLGLVDGIPDSRILRNADPDDADGDGISGRAHMVDGRVGRFGWKAQLASLEVFAADAYLNEMGITSPTRPNEVAPQGGPVVCDTVPDPEDDGTSVQSLTDFMMFLAPPEADARTRQIRRGRRSFRKVKCRSCHVEKLRSGPNDSRALKNKRVRLYSDLLLHDMGPELADGIEQGDATGSEFRTQPLWGVDVGSRWLHDGRARSLRQAILLHGGEATASRDLFEALPEESQEELIAFLRSL